jgi:hypothetical protein
MNRIKRKLFAGLAIIMLMLSMVPTNDVRAKTSNNTKDNTKVESTKSVNLIAEQNRKVGTVTIDKTKEGYLRATYELDSKAISDGWRIYEINLAVGSKLYDIPQSKGWWGANPIPAYFPYKRYFKEGVLKYVLNGIDISRFKYSTDLYISAHSVIKKSNNKIVKAPYGGSRVYDYNQGLDYNGDRVITVRSNPENGLHYETGMSEQNFFTLGFGNIDMNTGWIIIEFDYPIINGKGYDLEVIEDTWIQPYNLEQAEVSVSNDRKHWVKLGVAGNTNPISDYHTSTKFDLSKVCISSAKYVKIQDISDYSPAPEGDTPTDGFDLNAVLALHDYQNSCNKYIEEVAWGEGIRFSEKSGYGMYFTMKINGESSGFKYTCNYLYWLNMYYGSKKW